MKGMRVLFCCLPAHGHLYPMLPLAASFKDAGHDVRFGTGPTFVPLVEDLGYPADPVGLSIDEASRLAAQRHPTIPPGPELGLIAFAEVAAAATTADLLPLLERTRPDLVVYEETQFGGAVAARLAGIPAVGHALGRQMDHAMYRAGLSLITPLWTASGPMPDFFAENAYLDICPPSLRDPAAAAPARRLSLRPVSTVAPGDGLPAWVTERSRPLVYLTLGTYVYQEVNSLRAAALGLSRLDVDVLVTVGPDGDPAAIGPLPPRSGSSGTCPRTCCCRTSTSWSTTAAAAQCSARWPKVARSSRCRRGRTSSPTPSSLSAAVPGWRCNRPTSPPTRSTSRPGRSSTTRVSGPLLSTFSRRSRRCRHRLTWCAS